jgi:hypothetical protein
MVTTQWINSRYETITRTFSCLEDAILTFRKLLKARRPDRKVISNLRYKLDGGEWITC